MLSITLQAADTVSSIFAPVSTPATKEAELGKMVRPAAPQGLVNSFARSLPRRPDV